MQKTLFSVGVKRHSSELPPLGEPSDNSSTVTDTSVDSEPKEKRGRTARLATVKNWKCDWLDYEEKDGIVWKIWCKYCREFPDVAQGRHNSGQKQFIDCAGEHIPRAPYILPPQFFNPAGATAYRYINGTTNVKLSAAKHHENTDGHEDAKKANAAKYKPTETPMHKSIRALHEDKNVKMVKLFNAAYYIAKTEMAFSDYPGFVKFEVMQGIEHGQTYCNPAECRKFIEAISEVFESELKTTLAAKRLVHSK